MYTCIHTFKNTKRTNNHIENNNINKSSIFKNCQLSPLLIDSRILKSGVLVLVPQEKALLLKFRLSLLSH